MDMGAVRAQIEQERAEKEKAEEIDPPERAMTHQEKVEAFLDKALKSNPTREAQQTGNPTEGRIARSRQSGPSSEKRSPTARDDSDAPERRPSVRKQLDEIRQEQKKKAEESVQKKVRQTQEHKPPKKKKKPYTREGERA